MINDGRIFIGAFACIDKKNIIIINTGEYRIGGPAHGQLTAMVMVHWLSVLKVEAHRQACAVDVIEIETYV